MFLVPQASYVVTRSFQMCITDKYPMVVAFLSRIDCVDCSILFSFKERGVPVMSSTCTHLSSICLIYDTTLARSLHGSKCPLLFYQDRDHVRGLLLFDILSQQKDDVVWRGRSHHDACEQQRSTSNEVAGLFFVVGRMLHVVGKAVVTYEHDDVVWLV